MCLKLVPLVVVCLLFAVTAKAQAVVESQMQLAIGERESKLRLVVDSPGPMRISAKVEFVAPSGSVGAAITESLQLTSGRNEVDMAAPVDALISDTNFPYYTLRYE